MPSSAIVPGISLVGSLLGGSGQKKAASQQSSAAGSSAQAMTILNDVIRQIINQQLDMYAKTYQPIESRIGELGMGYLAGDRGIPFSTISSDLIRELMSPYQLPPQIRQKMLEGIQTQENRQIADTMRVLMSQGITGAPVAKAVGELQEAYLPQRYRLERDLAIHGAEKEETRKLQGENIARQIFQMLTALGQAGRNIPPYATGTMQNMVGQYGNLLAAMSQPNPYAAYQAQQQQNMWSGLGSSLANILGGSSSGFSTPTSTGMFEPIGSQIGNLGLGGLAVSQYLTPQLYSSSYTNLPIY